MGINVMDTGSLIFACGMAGFFVAMILYVVFGQITVRKLRKKTETKDKLGVEFVSGSDILNIAQALALPKFITKKMNKSPISFFHADTELLIRHTSYVDRVLASILYWLLVSSLILILSSAIF
ncbi:MAG: hypothetical protein GY799_27415 [Desulfobulbaceae bacterium]|nr:hypothetical protein [Desulfobulbaceae bacterium]